MALQSKLQAPCVGEPIMLYALVSLVFIDCWASCVTIVCNVFPQVVKVHQTTVDTYLEDIIMGAIDKTAEDQVWCSLLIKTSKSYFQS